MPIIPIPANPPVEQVRHVERDPITGEHEQRTKNKQRVTAKRQLPQQSQEWAERESPDQQQSQEDNEQEPQRHLDYRA
jgi:hypothetical protein